MALDTLPASAGPQRARLLRNIGLAFVRMGQYADAAAAYEAAVGAQAEHQVRLMPQTETKQPRAGQSLQRCLALRALGTPVGLECTLDFDG
jgi:Tfp pilus assembly protein PilF